jgi:hypothetical protein
MFLLIGRCRDNLGFVITDQLSKLCKATGGHIRNFSEIYISLIGAQVTQSMYVTYGMWTKGKTD